LAQIEYATRLLEETRYEEANLIKFLRRPETTWEQIVERVPELAGLPREVANQIDYDVKYAGYVARQEIDVARQRRLAAKRIAASFDYGRLAHLRTEAREKLSRVRPISLAQASRISGITPADVALLMVHLEGRR